MLKKNRILLILTIQLLSINQIVGQQDPIFTQYFDNLLYVNPAYAGSKEALNITMLHREQWLNFVGRPSTTTISIQSPLKYESLGIGLSLIHDRIGPITQTMVYGDFSYTLRFKNDLKLAFGLKGGVNILNSNTAQLQTIEAADAAFLTNIVSKINPNFGTGIHLHTKKWFVGLSTPKILEASYGNTGSAKERRHYFLTSGIVTKLSSTWKLRPMIQAKYAVGTPLSLDFSAAAIYRDKIWFGATYSLRAAVGLFFQVLLTEQFKLGMSTDFATTKLRKLNSGTFEIMLSYDFNYTRKGVRSPRYF